MGYTGSADGASPQPDGAEPARPGSRPVRRSLRNRAGAQAGGTALPPLESLYHAHYTSLVRLAALLTGDALLAQSVAADSMAALLSGSFGSRPSEPHLFWLHRQVVVRSRRAARGRATRTGAGGSGTSGSGTVGSGAPDSGPPESGTDGSGAGGTCAGPTAHGRPGSASPGSARPGNARPGSDPEPNLAWRSTPVIGLLAALSASQREAVVLRHYLELSDDETAAVMGASLRAVRRSLGAAQLALAPVVPADPRPDGPGPAGGGPDSSGLGAAGQGGPSC
jgi:DNA-directed RNA polymerase specialized sigma24 family protein